MQLKLIPADLHNSSHVNWIYTVRSHSSVTQYFFAPPPKNFTSHIQFLQNCISQRKRGYYIIYVDNEMAGYCQIINQPNRYELGLTLHPDWWGKGIGTLSWKELIQNCQNPSWRKKHLFNR